MRPERMKLPAILGILAGSGLALLSWSQTWFEVVLVAGAAAGGATTLEVGGAVASPAIAALALAGLALAGALAIAGPLIRLVLGLLAVVLGGCLVLAASLSMADPVGAASGAIAEATGVAGAEPTAALVDRLTQTAWPVVAVVGGALVALAGLAVVVTGRAWPTSRRYGGGTRLAADGAQPAPASDRAVDDWDGLSRGDDPTDAADEPHDGTR
ncbi:Trp biosynthesis-associated membrane protein [Agromyces aurantiacus]|uniref:Trp biosynthesis-associated membrane protein n=1 Tax=Agromyces aurantiacus TaxID=165814 RepID=A0ABV9R7T8_9MICO|nr:Trp biosynthesis-associated membrane protein [Agromyces aurantiacus]MBM7504883.1 putative membrane protein (TIGR02234 family) [Agromyces aurantiacus]